MFSISDNIYRSYWWLLNRIIYWHQVWIYWFHVWMYWAVLNNILTCIYRSNNWHLLCWKCPLYLLIWIKQRTITGLIIYNRVTALIYRLLQWCWLNSVSHIMLILWISNIEGINILWNSHISRRLLIQFTKIYRLNTFKMSMNLLKSFSILMMLRIFQCFLVMIRTKNIIIKSPNPIWNLIIFM